MIIRQIKKDVTFLNIYTWVINKTKDFYYYVVMKFLLKIIIILGIIFQPLITFANSEKTANNKTAINLELLPVPTNVLPEKIIYKEIQLSINSLDPKKNVSSSSYYPGLRGPNQLVVYTPKFGLRTGTNEFGTEAIVENNMVVRLNGADSIIPLNGFVISGHGTAKNRINQNIQVGSKVYIDYSTNSLRVFLTPNSLIFAAKERLKEVNSLIDYYKDIDILYNDKKASEYLEVSKNSLRKAEKKPEKAQTYITNSMDALKGAIKNAIPYRMTELKGVWIRPVEKTPHQISKTVSKIYDAGITDIFLETYFHGKTIYPSNYLDNLGIISQKEEFVGFDPMKIWIEEAHKRGMKIHVWFESFYLGNNNPKYNNKHVLSIHPDWSNKRKSSFDSVEPVPSLSEHNGYFFDPSNPDVQKYLLGIISELIEKYEIDGLNLDYIRYPQTVEPTYSNYAEMNWGYTQYACNEFEELYGINPLEIKYDTKEWDLWAKYRQDKIAAFIKQVNKLVKQKNILLTAVVFPDLEKSKATKMQNWQDWSYNKYVDGLTPLILSGDKNTAELLIKDVFKYSCPSTKIYLGIMVPFMGGQFEDLLVQIHKNREFKAKGAILFDYAHLNDDYINALKIRVFNADYEQKYKVEQKNEKVKKTKNKKIRRKKNAEN